MDWQRTSETPMEFQYDNKVGTIGSSPFSRLAQDRKGMTLGPNFGSQIKSPSPVRNPAFNPPNLPQTPKHTSYREQPDTDFSSAAESSPENGGNGADTEDTPELQRLENVTLGRGRSASKTRTPPAKRLSWLPQFRGHLASNALARRGNKRKRREVEKEDQQMSWTNADDIYNDSSRPSSSEGPADKQKKSFRKKAQDIGTIPAILTFIHEHPHLPTILAFWGQMLFSLFILIMLGFGIWNIWSAINQQIEVEAEKLGMDVLLEIRQCEKSWFANRCNDAHNVAPALEHLCEEWDHCRNQDWKAQGRAKIGAHTFASILNNFVEPLSYKFIICALAFVALLLFSPHQLFGRVRQANEAHLQQQQQQHGPPQGGFVPQTPSRQISNEWTNANGMQTGFFTPQTQQRQWDSMEWSSPSKRLEGRSRSPVKQLEFNKQYS